MESPKNTPTMFLGNYDHVNDYGPNDYTGAIRFNGANLAWGDIAYYPTGGDAGEHGHFRFTTSGNVVRSTPYATVGVGGLRSTGSICIGSTCIDEDDLKAMKSSSGGANGGAINVAAGQKITFDAGNGKTCGLWTAYNSCSGYPNSQGYESKLTSSYRRSLVLCAACTKS